jgi:hypothetical protein
MLPRAGSPIADATIAPYRREAYIFNGTPAPGSTPGEARGAGASG